MTKRTPLTDDQSDIYLRVVETLNFSAQGHTHADIAKWLGIDLAEVSEIIDEPHAYQKAHRITPRSLGVGAPIPTPDEIEKRRAELLRAKLAHKLAETSTHYDYDCDYQRPTVPMPRRKIRGF